ncbi:Deoxyribonuclease gamma [Taenia solium]|eukprot:TsM_000213100 transcript=TsM_000213100 gene=TsM_000213100
MGDSLPNCQQSLDVCGLGGGMEAWVKGMNGALEVLQHWVPEHFACVARYDSGLTSPNPWLQIRLREGHSLTEGDGARPHTTQHEMHDGCASAAYLRMGERKRLLITITILLSILHIALTMKSSPLWLQLLLCGVSQSGRSHVKQTGQWLMLLAPPLLLLVVCLLGLPAPSEESVKMAGFNVQVFGKTKSQKREVMKILGKIMERYDGVFVLEIRDTSGKAFPRLVNTVSDTSRPDKIDLVKNSSMTTRWEAFERPPDCFILKIRENNLKLGVLAVHIDPDDVKREMDALHEVANECERSVGNENLIILGDMNADCKYLPERDRKQLRLRTDHRYKWLIGDGVDTTVAKSDCAYDRVIVRGNKLVERIQSSRPFNFQKALKLPLKEVSCRVALLINA